MSDCNSLDQFLASPRGGSRPAHNSEHFGVATYVLVVGPLAADPIIN